MKYLLIIGDGMADGPIGALGGKTPLEYLAPPAMARVAAGEVGRFLSCPAPLPPGSDVAFLSILGCDPRARRAGRSPLEAAGMGVQILPGQTAFRMNLVSVGEEGYNGGKMLSHNGGGIEGEDAQTLARALAQDAAFAPLTIYPTDTFRHLAVLNREYLRDLTPPHDLVGRAVREGRADALLYDLQARSFEILSRHPVNLRRRASGLPAANSAWFWGAGTSVALPDFGEKFGRRGAVVSAVPLVKGIARLSGLYAPDVAGATGLLDTDYAAKVNAALGLFGEGYDFVLLHVEAPDELSHDGDLPGKLEAIARIDARVVAPMLEKLRGDFRIMLMPDHYTLLSTRTHDATSVPFAILDSRAPGRARPFTEALCADAPVIESGDALMRRFFGEGA